MGKTYVATRLEKDDFQRLQKLAAEAKLGRAEVARRLILIGLKHVQKVEDLLRI